MKRTLLSRLALLITAAFVICIAHVSFAQNREKYVISVKAGGVNSVLGDVTVHSRVTGDQRPLTAQDNLDVGDAVTTGPDGRIEVLLNPGTYMRVAENSQFQFEDTSLDRLRVRLIKGSAIVEAAGDDEMELIATVYTPQTKVSIVRRGIYRINVLPSNTTELVVRKGRAYLGDDTSKPIKDGKKAVVSTNSMEFVKADSEKDSLDLWSKGRAEMLAKANRGISGSTLAGAFSSILTTPWYNSWYFHTSYIYPRAGLWYFDPLIGYTFLPPYGSAWSPYGFGYTGWPVGYAWRSYWTGAIPLRRIAPGVGFVSGVPGRVVSRPRPVPSAVTGSDLRGGVIMRADRPGYYGSGAGRENANRNPQVITHGERGMSNPVRGQGTMSGSAPVSRPTVSAPARSSPGRRQ